MSEGLSAPEKQLMVELAVGLAQRMPAIKGGPGAGYPEPEYFWHYAASHLETACSVLWGLGVAEAAYGGDEPLQHLEYAEAVPAITNLKGFPPNFRVLSPHDIRIALEKGLPETSPSLDEMLSAYIGLVCEYGPEDRRLEPDRGPFYPPAQCRLEIEALERLGYIETNGQEARWTDKIAPAMQAAWLWDEEGRSRQAVEEERIARESATALAAISGFTRWRLRRAARRKSELDFAVFLRDRCGGLFLSKNADGSRRLDSSVALLKSVYRTLRQP